LPELKDGEEGDWSRSSPHVRKREKGEEREEGLERKKERYGSCP